MIPTQPVISAERQQEYVDRLAASRHANNDVLPGPLAAAFDPEQSIRVGNFTVRPMVASDRVLFKKLDSPFHRQAMAANAPVSDKVTLDMTEEETFELCFQFTRSPAECRAVLAKGGRAGFREAASSAIGDGLGEPEIAAIIDAISKQVARAAETWLQFSEKSGGNGNGVGEGRTHFFPVAEGQPKAPSAGISITAAAS